MTTVGRYLLCEQLFLLSYSAGKTVTWCWSQPVGDSYVSCSSNAQSSRLVSGSELRGVKLDGAEVWRTVQIQSMNFLLATRSKHLRLALITCFAGRRRQSTYRRDGHKTRRFESIAMNERELK